MQTGKQPSVTTARAVLSLVCALLTVSIGIVNPLASRADEVVFAVVGDFGLAGQPELDVANLVKSWNPEFVITVGDDNYPSGSASTIDANIGQYYQQFIYPYLGTYGTGEPNGINRFFPTLGNHDWGDIYPNPTGADPYLAYFTLPGNERYYDFKWKNVHFFAIDSDKNEPDGRTSASIQANWLKNKLAGSTSTWKLVYFHHPPYTSFTGGPTISMRWPFGAWGATAVLDGHAHVYERIMQDVPYMTSGLGGAPKHGFTTPAAGSAVRYSGDYGAMRVTARDQSITFDFITRTGLLIDSYTIGNTAPIVTNDSATTSINAPVTIPVLANDTDAEGDAMTLTAVSQPSHGTAVINSDDTLTYTPAPDFGGSDTFTYTVTDTKGASSTGMVTLTVAAVNAPPTAVNDNKAATEDTVLAFPSSDLTANDSPGPSNESGQTLTVISVGSAAHGTVALSSNGTITYTPAANYSGPDSFTYTVQDNGTTNDMPDPRTAVASVGIAVAAVNDAPIANPKTLTVVQDISLNVTLSGSDVETAAPQLAYAVSHGPAHGTLSGTGPNLVYTPAAGFVGQDSLTFTVTDTGDGPSPPLSGSAAVTINVTRADRPPSAASDSASTLGNTAVSVNVVANDTDPDGDTLTVTSVTQGTKGQVTIGAGGSVTYTPKLFAWGSDSFTYSVDDGYGMSATGSVSVTIFAADVTSTVQITRGATKLNKPTGRYQIPVSITNVSGTTIQGPISFVLDGLTGGTLYSPTGATANCPPAGSPYVTMAIGSDGKLNVSESSKTYTLNFISADGNINFTPRILADGGAR